MTMRNLDPSSDEKTTSDKSLPEIFPQLQEKRILFLTDEIDTPSANTLCGQLIMLDMQDPNSDIVLFINSQGGPITDTMAIYDVIQAIRADVITICIGEAASAGAILLSAGTKGKRYALPNSRIMLHQPQGGIEGSTRDVEIEAAELVRLRELLYSIFENNTGQSREVLKTYMDRDTYLSASEAKTFGIIDDVIYKLPDHLR